MCQTRRAARSGLYALTPKASRGDSIVVITAMCDSLTHNEKGLHTDEEHKREKPSGSEKIFDLRRLYDVFRLHHAPQLLDWTE